MIDVYQLAQLWLNQVTTCPTSIKYAHQVQGRVKSLSSPRRFQVELFCHAVVSSVRVLCLITEQSRGCTIHKCNDVPESR